MQEVEQHQVREVLRCARPPRPVLPVPVVKEQRALPLTSGTLPQKSATTGPKPARCAGLLHTIIFNRALGPVRPREVDSELFDITYVRLFTLQLTSSRWRASLPCVCVCLCIRANVISCVLA